ncbi:MAG: ABC transporter ATP-binding protein [Bacteroidales bacterium]|nr:ABC transporter ATP-binding protein [Bacteroidales bacterium]
MMASAIEFDHVSKQYRLGLVSTKTLSHDIRRFWITNILHHEDPYLKIGETNDRSTKGSSEYVWALKDINFKVEQGDVVGIIGKNGAGKSTLLKLLSRVTGPTTGTIRAHGRIGSLLEVGTGFHGEMTGRENIFMNGAILGMSRAEIQSKLDEIIDFSGCERYIDTPVKRYSSGMTVRLGFAVAAFLEPEILVVDEVLAVGDAEFQKKAIGKMKDVSQGQGRTVLFVSHNMASVRNLCKTGIVLKNGMMDFQGNVDDAIDHYLQSYADDFADMALADIPRTDKTNGIVRFLNYEFLNMNNEPIDPHCGQPLRIRLTLDVKEGADDLDISVGVRNSFGDPVMTFPSECTMDNFALTPGIHHAVLDIPKLPLTAGNYRLGLWATAHTPFVDCQCGDFIDNVIRLKVEDDTFFKNGKSVAPHLLGKVVLCDHKWEID